MVINPSNPEFLKWTLPLELGHVHRYKWGFQSKIKNRMADSVDLDEQSNLDLQFAQYLLWSFGLKIKDIYALKIRRNDKTN